MPMTLNGARRATLKAAIDADPALSVLTKTTANANRIADEFNKNSNPAVIVWKTSVTKAEALEMIAVADVLALTADQRSTLSVYLTGEVIPCDRSRVRAAFASLFGATGSATRLLALWKRTATRAEALYASGGVGDDASPHSLAIEGDLDGATIELVRA